MELLGGDLIDFLNQYGYLAAFLAMMFTGLIGTAAAGFLAGVGVFEPFYIWLMAIVADLTSDLIYYELGKRGGRRILEKLGQFFRWPSRFMEAVERLYQKHGRKAVFVVKFTHGLGAITQLMAGVAHMKRLTYVTYTLTGAVLRNALAVALGIFAGSAWSIWAHKIQNVALGLTILAAALILVFGLATKLQIKFLTDVSNEKKL